MWQNEFIYPKTAIYTRFWAICSKMQCVLLLNAVQYAAKRNAFWCKMQCVLVLNARQNAAKCKVKCRKMWVQKHKHTLQRYK